MLVRSESSEELKFFVMIPFDSRLMFQLFRPGDGSRRASRQTVNQVLRLVAARIRGLFHDRLILGAVPVLFPGVIPGRLGMHSYSGRHRHGRFTRRIDDEDEVTR
jgi:hypothetical protein